MANSFIGEIRMFAGNFAPVGWAFCDGSLMAISQNDALFTLIGTTYGGDGQSTFGLPDLRGRVPVHPGPGFILGQIAGEETVKLNTSQMPMHSHPAVGIGATGTFPDPAGSLWAELSGVNAYSSAAPDAAMNAGTLVPVGGSEPHENMLPFLVINFIISLFGEFPSQA